MRQMNTETGTDSPAVVRARRSSAGLGAAGNHGPFGRKNFPSSRTGRGVTAWAILNVCNELDGLAGDRGGLERELRHRLGDQQILYCSLRAAAAKR